ncbi:MAG: tRNA pseudouridine(38-40) synthase TruA [Bacteroidales bacterium]|nr:tRNA pseudouridine(38-40) synthase TruA [Bacteroidales bacterium]
MAAESKRYFLRLAFNGENYHGWQIQQNALTVQEKINNAISAILKTKINVVGCGRTDTGVHARQFHVHFDTSKEIHSEKEIFLRQMNGILPNDIVIYDLIPVKQDASARFDAVSRTYRYYISREKDPFSLKTSWFYHAAFNIDLMNAGANQLKNTRDFTSFSKVDTEVKTFICKLSRAEFKESGHLLVFTITADRFLRNMVRAIVGTLAELGRGSIDLVKLEEIIAGKNRSKAGYSVPAKGLFLEEVKYPADIFV